MYDFKSISFSILIKSNLKKLFNSSNISQKFEFLYIINLILFMKFKNNLIVLKDKYTLNFKEFNFKCCVGKRGISKKKIEGDNKTPKGTFELGNLFYRKDRIKKPITNLICKPIKKQMRWCNDVSNYKNYNKLIHNNKFRSEKIYRKDYKYNLFIVINYNFYKKVLGKGSAIFIHLTNDYKPTAGCIALNKKDFLILIKLINKKTKIKIS